MYAFKMKIADSGERSVFFCVDTYGAYRKLPPAAEDYFSLLIDGVSAGGTFKRTKNIAYALLLYNSDLVALTFYMSDNIPSWFVPRLTLSELKQCRPRTCTYKELLLAPCSDLCVSQAGLCF